MNSALVSLERVFYQGDWMAYFHVSMLIPEGGAQLQRAADIGGDQLLCATGHEGSCDLPAQWLRKLRLAEHVAACRPAATTIRVEGDNFQARNPRQYLCSDSGLLKRITLCAGDV